MNCLLIRFVLAATGIDSGFLRGALHLVPMMLASIVSYGDCYSIEHGVGSSSSAVSCHYQVAVVHSHRHDVSSGLELRLLRLHRHPCCPRCLRRSLNLTLYLELDARSTCSSTSIGATVVIREYVTVL